jgi:hypothetical protein
MSKFMSRPSIANYDIEHCYYSFCHFGGGS